MHPMQFCALKFTNALKCYRQLGLHFFCIEKKMHVLAIVGGSTTVNYIIEQAQSNHNSSKRLVKPDLYRNSYLYRAASLCQNVKIYTRFWDIPKPWNFFFNNALQFSTCWLSQRNSMVQFFLCAAQWAIMSKKLQFQMCVWVVARFPQRLNSTVC